MRKLGLFLLFITTLASAETGLAQGYPAPKEGDWIAKDFRFHTGEVMPELRAHYTTIGAPTGEPVLVLHGTTMSGTAMLAPIFAGELFGPGQALDVSKYYIILPDSLGHGKTAKPSDGLRTKFPEYDYDDMVSAQYRLVTEGLGVRHLRGIGLLDGWNERLDVGREVSGLHGHPSTHGLPAQHNVRSELDDAPVDHR